jgi:hypothetical protein
VRKKEITKKHFVRKISTDNNSRVFVVTSRDMTKSDPKESPSLKHLGSTGTHSSAMI